MARKTKINFYVNDEPTKSYAEFLIKFKYLNGKSSMKDVVKKINNIAFVLNKLKMSVKPKTKKEYDSWSIVIEETKKKEKE
jgi:hypothetical protein